jgi:hypothetical protein
MFEITTIEPTSKRAGNAVASTTGAAGTCTTADAGGTIEPTSDAAAANQGTSITEPTGKPTRKGTGHRADENL